MANKKKKKLTGVVEKIIKSHDPSQPEKAQIRVEGADELYKEIRIDNVVTDDAGKQTRLNKGEPVDLTVEAELETNEHRDEK